MEAVLADFRSWLQHLPSAAPADCEKPTAPSETIDLHTLLGQFLGVRHEVNLQTKAARSGQEQTGEALQQLSQALEAARQAQAAAQRTNQQAQDETLRPLLKTLLDVHDALSLAEREIRRAQENVLPLLDELACEPLPSGNGSSELEVQSLPESLPLQRSDWMLDTVDGTESARAPATSLWRRWFGRSNEPQAAVQSATLARLQAQRRHLLTELEEQRKVMADQHEQYRRLLNRQQERQQRERAAHQERQEEIKRIVERLDPLMDSIITGYRMSLQRLDRALRDVGLEPIPCVGEPFDPEQMEVVAAVADSGRPAGEVIEEVRRGYRWRGRVFRYAQVSVAKTDKETSRQGDKQTGREGGDE
jgi:molecular chaperone GrpE